MISEFPLFLFTLLGGAAAGAYVFAGLFPRNEARKPWLFPLIALVLLGASGIALLTHLGRPERVFGAFANPGAGITLEGYTMIFFGLMALVDLVVCARAGKPNRAVAIVAAIAGLLLLCAMGYAYGQFIGTPLWNTPATYPFFIVGGLALGSALVAPFVKDGYANTAMFACALIAMLLAAVSCIAVGAHFAANGASFAPFAAGAVACALAAGAAAYARFKKASWATWTALALIVVGMAIARYAFYCI